MRDYIISKFIDKNCKVLMCDGNEENGVIRDFDTKYVFLDTGKLTLIPHRRIDRIREI